MRKIKDVLRLKFDAKLSHQQIADALGLSKGVVTKYAGLAVAAGLDWLAMQSMDEGRWSGGCWPAPRRGGIMCSRTMAACTRNCAAKA